MTGLAELIQISQDVFWLHAVVFLRVGPVISLFPGIGDNTVSVRIKLALALAFTVICTPAAAPYLAGVSWLGPGLAWIAVTETAVGLIIGIGVRLFLLAMQTAGSIAAQATSLAQISGSAGTSPMPAMGHVLTLGAIALAMLLGLHVRVAEMVIATYRVFPVGAMPDAADTSQWGIAQVARAFSLAFTLAAPFVIVSVLYNLTLGIINRAMPQMMVVFVGAPVITLGGLLMLFLLAPGMLTLWMRALEHFVSNPFGSP
ncbi:flagellar biosynthetic protein FliR [Rhodobacteraceae bacterium KMM 6894]|nr:flagellar biosynthetic protein FliR [Rhodobacteraceae bacterium KMM 6894]